MHRVLIADDNTFVRVMLIDILQEINCDIVGEATNGSDAVQKCKSLKPDITLLDVNMPGLDGISVLRLIRAHDPAAVVIMVSSTDQDRVVAEAISSGARDFIFKPIDVDRLKRIITNI